PSRTLRIGPLRMADSEDERADAVPRVAAIELHAQRRFLGGDAAGACREAGNQQQQPPANHGARAVTVRAAPAVCSNRAAKSARARKARWREPACSRTPRKYSRTYATLAPAIAGRSAPTQPSAAAAHSAVPPSA